jgi:hypothetical protein
MGIFVTSREKGRFARNRFIEATNAELMLKLEKRGFFVCVRHTNGWIVLT